jgi:copper transport protein
MYLVNARALRIVAIVAMFSSVAWGHAKLVRSSPQANSVLTEVPMRVELWFSVKLKEGFNSVTVSGENDQRVDYGKVRLAENSKKLEADLKNIQSGTYLVIWSVISSDEHKVNGKFSFKVSTQTATATIQNRQVAVSTPSVQQNHSMGGHAEDDSPLALGLSIIRWILTLAMLSLYGGFSFHVFVYAPALKRETHFDLEIQRLINNYNTRYSIRLFLLSLVLLIVAAVAGLVFQSATLFSTTVYEAISPSLLSQTLKNTDYGSAWLIQVALIVTIAFIILLLRGRKHNSMVLWWLGLLTSSLLLLTLTLTGHSAVAATDYKLAIPVNWLHMIAASSWAGGVIYLAFSVPSLRFLARRSDHARLLSSIIARFNLLAMLSVGLVILTGLYNTLLHIETLTDLWTSSYGRVLLVKLTLVLFMLAFGGVNKLVFHPAIARSVNRTNADPSDERVSEVFRWSVRTEAFIGVMILLIASALSLMPPPK